MRCDVCRKRHLVAFSCKGRGFRPSCMGRHMNEGSANLVDHVLPEDVSLRQLALTLPKYLCYSMAGTSRYILWHELLKCTFGGEVAGVYARLRGKVLSA